MVDSEFLKLARATVDRVHSGTAGETERLRLEWITLELVDALEGSRSAAIVAGTDHVRQHYTPVPHA